MFWMMAYSCFLHAIEALRPCLIRILPYTVLTVAPYRLQKIKSILIRLVSSANTGYIYATTKNPTNIQHKLAFMKYDPIVRQHVLFTEAKMPKSRGGRRAGK